MAKFQYRGPQKPPQPEALKSEPRYRFIYCPRRMRKHDTAPADAPVCRMMRRAHDLRDRYPGQSRLAWRDLIEYLIAIPPPKELV